MEQKLKVAYILHRFPHLTATYMMREMTWVKEQEIDIHIFSLLPPKRTPVHEQARALLPYTRYSPFLSWDVIKAQLHFLGHRPGAYFQALVKTVWQTYREPALLLRALVIFPKGVYFARQMEELEIDHVHAHFVWLEGIVAGIVADLLGITFTIHPHAFGLFSRNQRDVRCELENASQIVTISDYHRAYIASLSRRIAPDDVEVVYIGIETDRFLPAVRQPGGSTIRILSVGSHVEKKGHEYLIDACALLAERGLDFECLIVGIGPLQEALQTRIDRHDLRDRVTLLGALEQARILELCQTSDVFALACVLAHNGDRDGMPIVLIEAMACELPVVTTPVTGIPELVSHGQTGVLVEERDASGLADALERLILDETMRKRIGKQARQAVLDGFQIQDSAVKLASIFRQVSGQR